MPLVGVDLMREIFDVRSKTEFPNGHQLVRAGEGALGPLHLIIRVATSIK